MGPQMKPQLGFGRKVSLIEYHMDLFTRSNFACPQDLIDGRGAKGTQQSTANQFGWYYSEAMTRACPGNLGVIDAMKMFKFTPAAYNKTDAFLQGRAWLDHYGWGDLSEFS